MKTPTSDAILVELRDRVAIGEVVSLLAIGPVLVARDYTQEEIMFGLEYLAHRRQIEFVSGNRVRLLK